MHGQIVYSGADQNHYDRKNSSFYDNNGAFIAKTGEDTVHHNKTNGNGNIALIYPKSGGNTKTAPQIAPFFGFPKIDS